VVNNVLTKSFNKDKSNTVDMLLAPLDSRNFAETGNDDVVDICDGDDYDNGDSDSGFCDGDDDSNRFIDSKEELMIMMLMLMMIMVVIIVTSIDYRKRNEDSMNHRCVGILAMFRHRYVSHQDNCIL